MQRIKYLHRDNIKTALLFLAINRDDLQKKYLTPEISKELKYLDFVIDEFSTKVLENFEYSSC